MTRTGRLGALIWVLLAAVVLLWPVPVDRPVDRTLAEFLRTLHRAGMPRWIDYDTVEFSANVLLFAPLGAFLVLALVRRIGGWCVPVTIATGLAVSLAGEFLQGAFLAQRLQSASDVAANALGTVIAAIVAWLAVRARRR